DVVYRRRGQDAMAEIEDVSGAVADLVEDAAALRAHERAVGEQYRGVEVALHRGLSVEALERLAERRTVIDAEHGAAGAQLELEQGRGVGAEVNGRYAGRQRVED